MSPNLLVCSPRGTPHSRKHSHSLISYLLNPPIHLRQPHTHHHQCTSLSILSNTTHILMVNTQSILLYRLTMPHYTYQHSTNHYIYQPHLDKHSQKDTTKYPTQPIFLRNSSTTPHSPSPYNKSSSFQPTHNHTSNKHTNHLILLSLTLPSILCNERDVSTVINTC